MAGKGNPPLDPKTEDGKTFLKKLVGQNLQQLEMLNTLPPITIDDFDEINNRIANYLQWCVDVDRYPTVTGLAVGMGIDRGTFYSWQSRKPDHPTVKYLKKVQSMIAENLEQAMLVNKTNPVTSIFLLKSTHGYKEANETVITHKSELGSLKSQKEIEKEIDADIIDAEFDEKP